MPEAPVTSDPYLSYLPYLLYQADKLAEKCPQEELIPIYGPQCRTMFIPSGG